uniref:Non-specific serine/threonine protein kinase n=1 Tax=Bursaphelenchus xylophilus TaxID=6326 RepID=A0A1I7S743_BURXY
MGETSDVGNRLADVNLCEERHNLLLEKIFTFDVDHVLPQGGDLNVATAVTALLESSNQMTSRLCEILPECLEVCCDDHESFEKIIRLIAAGRDGKSLLALLEYLWRCNDSTKYQVGSILLESDLIRVVLESADLTKLGLVSKLIVGLFEGQDRLNIQKLYTLLSHRILHLLDRFEQDPDSILNLRELHLITSSLYQLCMSTNLFLIMTLSPSLLNLLLCEIRIDDENLVLRAGSFHFQCLCLALNFCKTHGFFIATSSYLAQKSKIESPSSGYLQLQLQKLGKVLSMHKILPMAVLDVCLEWCFLISNQVGNELLDTKEMFELRKSILDIFLDGLDPLQSRINRLVDDLQVFAMISGFSPIEMDRVMSKLINKMTEIPTLYKQIPLDVILLNSLRARSICFDFGDYAADDVDELRKLFTLHSGKKLYLNRLIQKMVSDLLNQSSLNGDYKHGCLNEIIKLVNINILSILSSRNTMDLGSYFCVCHALMELIEQVEKRFSGVEGKGFFKVFDFSYEIVTRLLDCAIDVGRPEFIITTVLDYCRQEVAGDGLLEEMLAYLTWGYVLLGDTEAISDVQNVFFSKLNTKPNYLEAFKEFSCGRVEICLNMVDIIDINDLGSNPVLYKMINWVRRECLRFIPIPQIRRQLAPNAFHALAECNENLDSNVLMGLVDWNLPIENSYDRGIQKTIDIHHSDVRQLLQSWLTSDQFYSNPMKSIYEMEQRLSGLVGLVLGGDSKPSWKANLNALQTLFKVMEYDVPWQSLFDNAIDHVDLPLTDSLKAFDYGQTLSAYFERSGVANLRPSPKFYTWLSSLAQKTGNQMLLYHYSDKSFKINPQRLYAETQMTYLTERLDIAKFSTAVPQNIISDGAKLYSLFCQTLGGGTFDVKLMAHISNQLGLLANRIPGLSVVLKTQITPGTLQDSLTNVNSMSTSQDTVLRGALLNLATSFDDECTTYHKDFYDWISQQYYTSEGSFRLKDAELDEVRTILAVDGITVNGDTVKLIESSDSYQHFVELECKQQKSDLIEFTEDGRLRSLYSNIKKRERALFQSSVKTLIKILTQRNTINLDGVCWCLEILKLLLIHPEWFDAHVTDLLSTHENRSWLETIPQLLGVLKHKNEVCSSLAKKLVLPLIDENPDHFVYPLLSVHNHQVHGEYHPSPDPNIDDDGISLGIGVFDLKEDSLSGTFNDVVNYFKAAHPELSLQTVHFLRNFDEFSLTLPERWHHFLSHLNTEVITFRKSLKSYYCQLERIVEKTKAMKLLADIEDIFRNTVIKLINGLVETTDEIEEENDDVIRFRTVFGDRLNRAVEECSLIPSLDKFFNPFSKLIHLLSIDIQRQDNHNLKLSSLSVGLSSLNASMLPLPGLGKTIYKEIRRIHSLGDTVHVLPTKTRPKKLSIVDNAGERHVYLCKGQEDLRLDERISGLLSLCNAVFRKGEVQFKCRNYSVIPLSDRTGLIQWVSGASSIYQVYKNWHLTQLEACLAAQNKEIHHLSASSDDDGTHQSSSEDEHHSEYVTVEDNEFKEQRDFRPVKKFYAVLKEILPDNEKCFAYKDRTFFTPEVLVEAFERLKEMSPKTIISDYILKSSINSIDWVTKVGNYTRSIASANMVGNVVDLGDRHLDNILIDQTTGDLIHVDFNVCFHKRKTLRVPEKVPFRLTQNFVDVLGVGGVNGKYKVLSAQVLESLKKNKTMIINWLSVFQTDPLTEWLVPNDPISNARFGLFKFYFCNNNKVVIGMILHLFSLLLTALKGPLDVSRKKIENLLEGMLKEGVKQDTVSSFHELVKSHQESIQLLKPFLKILSTCFLDFKGFVTNYKLCFSSPMAKILRGLMHDPGNIPRELLKVVLQGSPRIYANLIGLSNITMDSYQEQERVICPSLRIPENIMRRLSEKLNGYEAGQPSMMTTLQQVEYLATEATSRANLSQMFEGWMAWI